MLLILGPRARLAGLVVLLAALVFAGSASLGLAAGLSLAGAAAGLLLALVATGRLPLGRPSAPPATPAGAESAPGAAAPASGGARVAPSGAGTYAAAVDILPTLAPRRAAALRLRRRPAAAGAPADSMAGTISAAPQNPVAGAGGASRDTGPPAAAPARAVPHAPREAIAAPATAPIPVAPMTGPVPAAPMSTGPVPAVPVTAGPVPAAPIPTGPVFPPVPGELPATSAASAAVPGAPASAADLAGPMGPPLEAPDLAPGPFAPDSIAAAPGQPAGSTPIASAALAELSWLSGASPQAVAAPSGRPPAPERDRPGTGGR